MGEWGVGELSKYKVVIAYDGTAYSGWQYQENAVGIQQVVEDALAYLDGAPVRVYGSSRTDAGVHAKGFVAHFHLTKPIPAKNLVRAMNARLPDAIRVLKAAYAKEDFDARLSAKGKEYRYQLYQADIMPPHLAPYWTFCHRPLDLAAMKKAASYFVGKHDFVSFAANPDRVLDTTVRSVFSFEVKKAGPRYTFIVRGERAATETCLRGMNPLLLDLLSLNLEEVFIYEMEALGYAFKDILM